MAETDVSNSSEQVTSSKYSSRLTYGLLAFIGGFAGLHTFYGTGKISSYRTVLSGCFLYFLVSYNYWYLYASYVSKSGVRLFPYCLLAYIMPPLYKP